MENLIILLVSVPFTLLFVYLFAKKHAQDQFFDMTQDVGIKRATEIWGDKWK